MADYASLIRPTGYGPGDIEQAHAPNEWVSLETTEQVARALVQATGSLLATDPETLRRL